MYNICTHNARVKYIFHTIIFLVPSERAIQVDLYEKIKELAALKRISIRQLEEQIGIANGTIRRWGKTNPSMGAITKVADYFNVSVDYLLGREEEIKNGPIDLTEIANSDDEAVWDKLVSSGGRPLTEKDKAMIRLVFADRWDEITQKAKDIDNNK